MKVAVVGAGIMGAATALALVDRQHDVTVFDPRSLADGLGSSHGNSRIVRRAYPDPFYTGIMREAYPLWTALESRTGVRLLDECGLLYFGEETSPTLRDVTSSLGHHGVLHEIWNADRVRSSAGLELRTDEIGVWTPGAGWVHASEAVRTCLNVAGVSVVRETVDPFSLAGQFDRVIVCAGGWTSRWFPLAATVTRQTFAYFELNRPWAGSVWIEDSQDFLYGFPSEPGTSTIKIGVHSPGPVQDPDNPDRTPDPRALERIALFVRQRFREEARLASAHTCLYTTTPDEDFRFGQVDNRIYWASPCSGHGFKFGLWVGQLMAKFVEGEDTPANWPRFLAT